MKDFFCAASLIYFSKYTNRPNQKGVITQNLLLYKLYLFKTLATQSLFLDKCFAPADRQDVVNHEHISIEKSLFFYWKWENYNILRIPFEPLWHK